jgi:hypothetical protein
VKVRGHFIEEGPMSVGSAESHPVREQVGSVGLSRRYDAAAGRFRRSEQFRAKSISSGRWHMRQGLSCGKRWSNSVSNCSSVRS